LSQNRWLEFVARWLVGLVFIYASLHKIEDPAAFAKTVYGYGLFPASFVNLIAIVLPFVELITGIALLIGVMPRAAASIVLIMLVMFIVVISINLARGHEFDCGCFKSANDSGESPWVTLVRDIVLLSFGMFIYKFNGAARRILAISKN
jgi:uncharacterized membrane protein YphA (DoxX/SURF4 family)